MDSSGAAVDSNEYDALHSFVISLVSCQVFILLIAPHIRGDLNHMHTRQMGKSTAFDVAEQRPSHC